MACKFKIGNTLQWTPHMIGVLGLINSQYKFEVSHVGGWHDDSTNVDHMNSQYKVGCQGCYQLMFTSGQHGWEHYYELVGFPLAVSLRTPINQHANVLVHGMPSNVVKYPEITTKAAHATPLVMNHPCCGWCGRPVMGLYEPKYGTRTGCPVHGVGCPEVKIDTKSRRHP